MRSVGSDRRATETQGRLNDGFAMVERALAALGNAVREVSDEIEGALSGISRDTWRKWSSYERRRRRAVERSRRNNDEMRRRGKTR